MSSAKKSNTNKKLYWLIGILLTCFMGAAAYAAMNKKETPGTEVEVQKAEKRDLTQIVTASGKVQPETEVKISPDVSGEIITLTVKEGDFVQRGQLLVRIKPDFYVSQVEQAEASVNESKSRLGEIRARLLQAQNEFTRLNDLFAKGVLPKNQLDQAQTDLKVAQSSLESANFGIQAAQARAKEAREQLNKTAIYAPMSGTISQLNVELGERVLGTSQMTGTEMMRIARLDQMELLVDVNENDIVNVRVGNVAAIEIDAYPGRKFRGEVTEIANSARISAAGTQNQVTNFPVKIRLFESDFAPTDQDTQVEASADAPQFAVFRSGMSGTADVQTKTVHQAIAIPIGAVTMRDFNKKADTTSETAQKEDLRKVVFIMQKGKAKRIKVQTGLSDETHVEIINGLMGDERVVVAPFSLVSKDLNDGDAIKVKP